MKKVINFISVIILMFLIINVEAYGIEPQIETTENTNVNEIIENIEEPAVQVSTEEEPVNLKVNNLKRLKIEGYLLEPEFTKEIQEYYIKVDLNVDHLKITAIPEDENTIVNIEGNANFKEGENSVKIIAIGEDSTQTIYTIYVTKTDMINTKLKTLKVGDYDLYPDFAPNINKYNLTINESINELEVLAEAENANAKVEITGNKDLKEGSNTIKINVTAEDGITTKEYTINTFVSAYNVEVQPENKKPAITAIVVCSIIILVLAIYVFSKKN